MTVRRMVAKGVRGWAVALSVVVLMTAATYWVARAQQQKADAMQAAMTVRFMAGYVTEADHADDPRVAYDNAAQLQAGFADAFLLSESAQRLPVVARHIATARRLYENARRELAGGADWTETVTMRDQARAELDAATALLAEEYATRIPRDVDTQRPE
jgi:hypothetical protein